jgi:hypothetical protein
MADGLSQIAIEKLDENNFQMWKFRIMNFLMGKGYWEFITGDEKEPPLPENPTQQQIQAWDTLVKMYSTNTQTRKMQFK